MIYHILCLGMFFTSILLLNLLNHSLFLIVNNRTHSSQLNYKSSSQTCWVSQRSSSEAVLTQARPSHTCGAAPAETSEVSSPGHGELKRMLMLLRLDTKALLFPPATSDASATLGPKGRFRAVPASSQCSLPNQSHMWVPPAERSTHQCPRHKGGWESEFWVLPQEGGITIWKFLHVYKMFQRCQAATNLTNIMAHTFPRENVRLKLRRPIA